MLTPFLVPTEFDVNDPSKIRGPFRDLTKDFHLVTLDEAKLWQSYLLVHAADEELESCSWAKQILDLSMTAELKALVHNDLMELTQSESGAVSMVKLMTNHMVLRNQEYVDPLHDYIRTFDIRCFDGENVTTACTQLRAILRALDVYGLPVNALRCILTGFSHASSSVFSQLSTQLATMS